MIDYQGEDIDGQGRDHVGTGAPRFASFATPPQNGHRLIARRLARRFVIASQTPSCFCLQKDQARANASTVGLSVSVSALAGPKSQPRMRPTIEDSPRIALSSQEGQQKAEEADQEGRES